MLSEYKTQARRALHAAMAEPASYTAPGVGGETFPLQEQLDAGLTLTVRWHNKVRIVGERTQDDVGILEGVNRLVFNTDELTALGMVPRRLGLVTIPGYEKQFRLDYNETPDGPLNQYWSVIDMI